MIPHRILLVALPVALLGASLAAQNYAFTPAGTRHFIGNSNNTWPFSGASARYQQVHEAVDVQATNGRRPLVINGVSFRPDGIRAIVARSWDVQLGFGHTSVTAATISGTFSSNITSALTIVHPYKTVNVPAAAAGSRTVPNPVSWTLPFAVPFIYTPALGNLLWEWRSRNAFVASTPMDACRGPNGETPRIAPNAGTGCVASGQTNPAAADFTASGGNFVSTLTGARASTPAVLWIGLRRTELNLGWCQPLLLVPSIQLSGTTSATGTWSAGSIGQTSLNSTPYVEVYAQYGFVDASLPGGVGVSDLGIVTTQPNQALFMTRVSSLITSNQGYENATSGTAYRNSGLVTILNIL